MAAPEKQILTRLKTIEGHVRGVQRMIETDAYCIDLIKQIQAIQRALDKVNAMILETYLRDEVTNVLRQSEQPRREGIIAEVLTVYHALPGDVIELPTNPPGPERISRRMAWLGQTADQVHAIRQLLETDTYPMTLIHHVQTVQRMLKAFESRVLADHLDGCVTTAIRSDQPAERERVVSELLQVFTTGSKLI